MLIRQSDLASWSRCAQQAHLSRTFRQAGDRERVLSATAFGTVIHHAVQVMEELHHQGRQDACERAVETFVHHWHPDHIEALVPGGVDVWLPRQSYGALLIRGRDNLRTYHEHLIHDGGKLLALEHTFTVPMTIDGRAHVARGTVDRLALRMNGTKPFLCVEDFKSGVKPTFLRHAFQWTYYSWASTRVEFWDAWDPEDLAGLTEPLAKKGLALYRDGSGLPLIPRRGRWIALREPFGIHDTGWRTPGDFARMRVALSQYVAAVDAGIFPLSIGGQYCTFCPFAYDGSCGGTPIGGEGDGVPYPASTGGPEWL